VSGGSEAKISNRSQQRIAALRQANGVRTRRAQLKREIGEGSAQLDDLLARSPDCIGTAKVRDLLLSVFGIGPATASRMLRRCDITESRTAGALTDRQRTSLISLLKRPDPS
jgi:S13-like H2TH domain